MPTPLPGGRPAHAGFRGGILLLAGAVLMCSSFLASCTKQKPIQPTRGNSPPVISRLEIVPPRPHVAEQSRVMVVAVDPDGDHMSFLWTASGGTFPQGYQAASVQWRSPDEHETDTLTVAIGDQHFLTMGSLAVTLTSLAPPDSLGFRPTGASVLHLKWKASPDHTQAYTIKGWRGYEVFQADRSFAEITPSTIQQYLITPTPVPLESLGVMNLTPGVLYHFCARARRDYFSADSTPMVERSTLAPEITAYTLPEGVADLKEFDNPSGRTALDLSESGAVRSLVPADTSGIERFDFFVGSAQPAGQGLLMLKSVSLLREINPAWSRRQIGIKPVGTEWDIRTTSDDGWLEEAALTKGQVYFIKLPDGHYGKIGMFESVRGFAPYRFVTLRWAYQPLQDFLHL